MTKLKTLSLVFLLFYLTQGEGQLRIPRLISDGLILQRDVPCDIWGWAAPGDSITISLQGYKFEVITDADSNWSQQLPVFHAGGPYEIIIVSPDSSIVIEDIYFGDVWLCSGQSNMELPMKRVAWVYPEIIKKASYPLIRQFYVPRTYDFNVAHEDVTNGSWINCSPESVMDFSAVAFFFASEIYKRYDVPIGIINSALGGSGAECWINDEEVKKFPEHYTEYSRFRDKTLVSCIVEADNRRQSQWYSEANQQDIGQCTDPPFIHAWTDKDWHKTDIPHYWKDGPLGNVHGVVWYQKEFELREEHPGQEGMLVLGRVVDADSTWVNGHFVGNITYKYPPRRYPVKKEYLKEGKNVITVRVTNVLNDGGFWPGKDYQLEFPGDTIDLKKDWKYRLGAEMPPLGDPTFIRWKPVGLYNAMIHPLIRFPLKGVLWYQGESNAGSPSNYFQLMESLIRSWRAAWKQPELPFFLVQLANFQESRPDPYFSNWAWLRDQQLKASLTIPNTGLAVTIDIGEWNDIHPLNKQDVGMRLALAAQKIAYGEQEIVYSGPVYKSLKVDGEKAIVSFDHTGGGLMSKNG